MAVVKVKAELVNGFAGPLNPAIVGFAYDNDAISINKALAQITCYLCRVIRDGGLCDQYIQQFYVANSSGPFVATPFPATEYAAIRAVITTDNLPVLTDYNVTITGQVNLAPVGTSINVMEANLIGGRHNGRHYLPWVNSGAFASNGTVTAAIRTAIQVAAHKYLLDNTSSSILENITPGTMIKVAGTTTFAPTISFTAKPNPARLRSRIR